MTDMNEPASVTLPMTPETARSLRLGDMVYLEGEIVITAGLPTHHRLIECVRQQRPLPRDLSGMSLIHMGSLNQEDEHGTLDVTYINPTTSTRFNPMMPELIRSFGLTAIGGKGGMNDECVKAMQEVGCVYFSFIGGSSPILSDAVENVIAVDWEDMTSHFRLVTLRVRKLGPVTVAIDAHGNSLYSMLTANAEAAQPELIRELAQKRVNAPPPS